MPRIIGIDLSLTQTGYAKLIFNDSGQLTDSDLGTIKSTPLGTDWHSRAVRIRSIVDKLGSVVTPFERMDLIVVESPAFASKTGQAHDRSWLWGKAYDYLSGCGEVVTATPSQVKKYITGKGNADKDVVLAHTIKRLPQFDVFNNNVADATVLADMGARAEGMPLTDLPAAQQKIALELSR